MERGKKVQRFFPFSYIVNTTFKNIFQELMCLEIVFVKHFAYYYYYSKIIYSPVLGVFPLSITNCGGPRDSQLLVFPVN